jgi:hypothetical protein
VLENERPVFLVQVLVEVDAQRRSCQQPEKRCLAHSERVAPQIIAVKLDQIKRPREHAFVTVPSPDQFKTGDPVATARDRLPVNDAGPGAQPCEGLDNEWKPVGQIIARPAVELNSRALLAGDYPKAIVLDLMEPNRT